MKKQRQTTIEDFIDIFESNEFLEELEQAGDYENKKPLNAIEDNITTFLKRCTYEKRVPTLEEAQSIAILDAINSKYNGN